MGNRPKIPRVDSANICEIYYGPAGPMPSDHWHPPMDLSENDREVLIRMDIPGVQPEDLRVSLRDRVLRIEGLRREPELPPGECPQFICLERGYGSFRKTVEMQWVIDPRDITAALHCGVLTVVLPKLADRRHTEYEIPVKVQPEE